MPRLRAAARVEGDAPAELLDPGHSIWRSERSTKQWLTSMGLATLSRTLGYGPRSRFGLAAHRWLMDVGMTQPTGPNNDRPRPDWRAMREAGIPFESSSGDIHERFAYIGVTVHR